MWAALVGLALGIGGLLLGGSAHARVQKARAAVLQQGIDPRLLSNAEYSRATVQLAGPPRESDIVAFSSDIADEVYMAYLEPRTGALWWLDELSGTGEVCVRTTLYQGTN